jgi:hypothetical protein
MPCVIESSEVRCVRSRSTRGGSPETCAIEVLFRYEFAGHEYRSNRYQLMGGSSSGRERKAAVVGSLPPGTVTTCFVNPEDPASAVINRGITLDFRWGLLPVSIMAIGLIGMAFFFWAGT